MEITKPKHSVVVPWAAHCPMEEIILNIASPLISEGCGLGWVLGWVQKAGYGKKE